MRKNIKILIVFITVIVTMTITNINAATGYTYDHKGEPIYSTVGLNVNQNPYLAGDLGIDFSDFSSPEDLFVYTDDEGNHLVYIVDSRSNNLYVLDEHLKLKETIFEFKLDVNKFSDEVLREIKSSGQYVISRDTVFSIPQSMENVNLVFNNSEVGEIKIDYAVKELDYEYVIEWESSDENIAFFQMREEEPYIVSTGLGDAKITGSLFNVKDMENPIETVQININVTEQEDTEIPQEKKGYGFSIPELRNLGTLYINLHNVKSVYRSAIGEDYIYIADKGNNQVIVIDSETYEIEKFVTVPQDRAFEEVSFSPNEVVTDRAGRIYVIADNVSDGIMQFSSNGEFNRYTGVNYVTLSPWEAFWRKISTEAQLSKQKLIINTSFTSITVDKDGFIYTTSNALKNDDNIVTDDKNMIKKINPTGEDVLRRNGYENPMGDVEYLQVASDSLRSGPSMFSGITVNDYGVYSVLDSKMGKIFTYDNEGNLLYISGEARYSSSNSGVDVLSNPVAIAYMGEEILILDKNSKAVIIYEPTDIAKLINTAVEYESIGDKMSAAEYWEEIIKLNANYEYAYIGIGRKYLEEKDYKTAMEYFKYGKHRELYSRAFKMDRDAAIRKYFTPVVVTVIALSIGLYVYKKVKHRNDPVEYETGMGDE